MKPLKILTVAGWIYPDAEGGSFRFVYELNRALARRGHRPTVLTQRLRPDLPAEQDIDGIRVIRYRTVQSGTFAFYRSTIASVRRVLRQTIAAAEREGAPFDLVHLHHPASAFAAALACPPAIPMVHTLCIAYFLEYLDRAGGYHNILGATGGHRLGAALLRRMEAFTLGKCRRVAVFSDSVARQVEQYYPAAADRVVKIPGGVDLRFFNPSLPKAEARALLGLPPDVPLLLTVRRLEPRMGINNLIDAMPAIRAAFPNCLLLIGGRGVLEAEIRRQIQEEGLADAVQLCGFIEEKQLPAYYRAADAFVLPTRALEGFGMVTLEAFACGTPAVVTPAGASREVAAPVDQELVAAGTGPREIADAVIAVLRRPDRDGLAWRCRAYAEQFSWEIIAGKYEELYAEIIEAGAARQGAI